MNRKDRIDEIIEVLEKANDYYYNKAQSIITDSRFDSLKDELKKLAPNHKFLLQVGQKVSPTTEWKKAKHRISMTSLNKVNRIDEFRKWGLDMGCKYFTEEDKLDGGSIDLEYDNGDLIKAITRGDGFEGEDIFSNVIKMKNVKKKIPGFTGSLRGEIFIFADDFEKLNKILIAKNIKPMANPRNGAVGICKRYDGSNSEFLSILYYDLAGKDFDTEFEKMEFIKNDFCLQTSFYKRVTLEEAIKLYNDYEAGLRAGTPYDIDGLVIKVDEIAIQEKHGLIGSNPKAQIAWKFTSMKKETIVEDCFWQVGNSRTITPVAKVQEVPIGGVRVNRASLANYARFMKLKMGKGDKVLVSRRNDVIPYLEEVLISKGNPFKAPTHCPECNTELEIMVNEKDPEKETFLICPNDDCPALQTGNLIKWIYGLEIKGIGVGIIEHLFEEKLIKEPADFYKLKVSDIANLEGLGERSANKILKNLDNNKHLTLPEFIGNLNMYQFSTSRVETLVEAGFDSVDKLLNAKTDDLKGISGIGPSTAKRVIDGLKSKKTIIENLIKAGITVKAIPKKVIKTTLLKGKSFCFTGAINRKDTNGDRFTREMMEALVTENSGEIGSVSKGLTFLVTASKDSVSSKTQKANALNISIISEEEFFKMLS